MNWAFLTPPAIAYYIKSDILTSKKYDLSSLKIVMTGGSKVPKEVVNEFKKQLPHVLFCSGYGTNKLFLILLS